MKRFWLGGILGLVVCMSLPSVSEAHPLDISVSLIDIDESSRSAEITTYLHPFEVDYFLKENGIKVKEITDVYKYKELIFGMIMENVGIRNEGEKCDFVSANLPPKDEFEIMGDGVEAQYEVECEKPWRVIKFENSLFAEDFDLQTNKMLFYKNGDFENAIYERILTSKITKDEFDWDDPNRNFHPDKDTDGDGLKDYEENLYMTNLEETDTDFDDYNDKEEVDNGWDPRNAVASMGQAQRVDPGEAKAKQMQMMKLKSYNKDLGGEAIKDEGNKDKENKKNEELTITAVNIPQKYNTPSGGEFFGTGYLTEFLKKIQTYLEGENALEKFFVLLLAFVLGCLHSLEPGHGKSILMSYLIDQI